MIVSSEDGKQGGTSLFVSSPGRKVGALIAVSYRKSQTGNKLLHLVYCVLVDKSKTASNDDTGRIVPVEVALTESMRWKLGNILKGHQVKGQVNLEVKADVQKALQKAVELDVQFKAGQDGKQYTDVKNFYASDVDPDDSTHADTLDACITEYQKFTERSGKKSGESRSQEPESQSGSGYGQQEGGTGNQSYDDDQIPF